MKYLIIPILLLILIIPPNALASGIQVSPTRLDFAGALPDTAMQKELIVANPGGDVQTFQIYAEDFPSGISAEPNDFALEPGGRKTIAVRVDMTKIKSDVRTNLDIISRPLSGHNLAVAAGVKIPLTIAIAKTPPLTLPANRGFIYLLLAAAILLMLNLALKKRLRSNR